MELSNPFVTVGYVSDKYFCDRKQETEHLIRELASGNNVALISTRRMGKTGLIRHCFAQNEIKDNYHTFFVDIYATKSLRDFVFTLSKEIFDALKPLGKKVLDGFVNVVQSLKAGISYDQTGSPSLNLGWNESNVSGVTLDEIFFYLKNADKPCIVAIDEFQQIASYSEVNLEAMLRTQIQNCNNVRFIFSGSQRHSMSNMFLSASRPFYQSVSMMQLESIPLPSYSDFITSHFEENKRHIENEIIDKIYNQFDGTTWYIQKILNTLYNITSQGETCRTDMLDAAIREIIGSYQYSYSEIMFRLPEKQKDLLVAIAKEGNVSGITSGKFVKKYGLPSSSIQAALKGLLTKDFVTCEFGIYRVYDRFLEMWIRQNY